VESGGILRNHRLTDALQVTGVQVLTKKLPTSPAGNGDHSGVD
jgi:hypothetical protein